jgi:glycosyltransferase involved in cell wall biosynthesis
MVRNMEPLTTPFQGNVFSERVRNLGRRMAAKRACQAAARVIAVSECVRDFLHRKWRIASAKTSVVYHGVAGIPAEAHVRPLAVASDLESRFFFTAGSIRPARGLEDIVTALSFQGGNSDYSLVIAGSTTPGSEFYKDSIVRLAAKLGVSDRIIWAGELDAAQMAWCFAHCAAFVMSSRVEACPNVVLEAMTYGCLCVSTDTAPMPEFFVGSAVYYPGGNAAILSQKIREALGAGDRIDTFKKLAVARSHDFTWQSTAKRTVDELEIALAHLR